MQHKFQLNLLELKNGTFRDAAAVTGTNKLRDLCFCVFLDEIVEIN